jgi:hypothetical protein
LSVERGAMANLQELASEIGGFFEERYRRFSNVSMMIKLLLVIGGSVVAGVAHFQTEENTPSAWHVAGIFAALAVGVGGILLVIAEVSDPGKELETARKAVEVAREQERLIDQYGDYQEQYEITIDRAIELYRAVDQMRSVIQNVLTHPTTDEIKTIKALLEAAERSLKIASGFEIDEHWTLCVYRAQHDETSKRTVLKCVADLRSIPCNLELARKWPEGVGVAGVAYASGGEITVPNLQAAEIGNRFGTGAISKDDDDDRYRSMVAVPVFTSYNTRPWGVVAATSDRMSHFLADEHPGIRTSEATRALAGMVALALEALNSSKLPDKVTDKTAREALGVSESLTPRC